MIARVTHMCIYVLNQDSACDFYTNKLGFKVKVDAPMGEGVRWLTVCPPEQAELEITLLPLVEGHMFKKDTLESMIELVKKGTFGPAVLGCKDIYATYEELKAKGVVFMKAPKQEFYALEALFKDDSGNWFSLTQMA
jgi:catechol 2,3-dioxygenase-like lactoylglutathione lyase family enzyme